MTPAEIIKSAAADGVKLALIPGGKIKARGADAAVDFWLPAIRQQKAGIVRTLTAESKSMANTTIGYRCPCGSISYLPRAFQWKDLRGGKHWGFSCLGCKTRYWMV